MTKKRKRTTTKARRFQQLRCFALKGRLQSIEMQVKQMEKEPYWTAAERWALKDILRLLTELNQRYEVNTNLLRKKEVL